MTFEGQIGSVYVAFKVTSINKNSNDGQGRTILENGYITTPYFGCKY